MNRMIVAYDQNRAIGTDGELPWGKDVPADLQHFKATTLGSAVIMGRITYNSIGHALPGRQNIILSRQVMKLGDAVVARTLNEALGAVESNDAYIIGGAELYAQSLEIVDQIIATEVHYVFQTADRFFPSLPESDWIESGRQHHASDEKNKYDYSFVTYSKSKNSR